MNIEPAPPLAQPVRKPLGDWRLLLVVILAATVSIAVGALLAIDLRVAAAAIAAIIALSAVVTFPALVPGAVVVGTALYYGIFLVIRLNIGQFPVSLLDLTPLVLGIAVLRLTATRTASELRPSGLGMVAVTLLLGGLIIGTVLGYLEDKGMIPMLRIIRVEVVLVSVFGLCLIGGRVLGWRRAVLVGLYVAGALAALQSIISFSAIELTGSSPFDALSAGRTPNSTDDALGSAGLGTARDNFLPIFVMLPALALCLVRLSKTDVTLALAILLAGAMSLSRGMWIAVVLTVATVALTHVFALRRFTESIRFAAVGALASVVVLAIAGTLVGARIQETLQPATDTSQAYRTGETGVLIEAITETPATFLAGAGAGTVVEAPYRLIAGIQDSSPIAENQLLARWLNFGLLSAAGISLALLGAGASGFVYLRRSRLAHGGSSGIAVNDGLAAMSLSLPAVLVVGFFAGTLLQLSVTIPILVLAGTVLAGRFGPSIRTGSELSVPKDSHKNHLQRQQ